MSAEDEGNFLRSTTRTAGRVLHLPDDDGQPLCGSHNRGEGTTSFRRVQIECYPPSWRRWCEPCRREYLGKSPARWDGKEEDE
jgi:hypothetical protein